VRKAALAVGVQEQSVQGAARDAGGGLELVGGATARRRPQDRDSAFAVDVGEHAQGGRFAGARDPDDADDTVGAERAVEDELPLLVRERSFVEQFA
jgi:hypothetical protein